MCLLSAFDTRSFDKFISYNRRGAGELNYFATQKPCLIAQVKKWNHCNTLTSERLTVDSFGQRECDTETEAGEQRNT